MQLGENDQGWPTGWPPRVLRVDEVDDEGIEQGALHEIVSREKGMGAVACRGVTVARGGVGRPVGVLGSCEIVGPAVGYPRGA
jgi:hypothetical protein